MEEEKKEAEQPKSRWHLTREDIKTIIKCVTVFLLVAIAFNVGMLQASNIMTFCAQHGQAIQNSLSPSLPNITFGGGSGCGGVGR